MERSARKVRALCSVLAVGLACAGCVGLAPEGALFKPVVKPQRALREPVRFDAVPVAVLEDTAALPAGLEPCAVGGLVAARGGETAARKKGFGFGVAYQSTVFSNWRTKMTDAVPTSTVGSPNEGQYAYKDLYSDGNGLSIFGILKRPPTATISSGDSYILWHVDLYQRFSGGIWDEAVALGGPSEFDPIEYVGFWIETKTMFTPVGTKLRPYVRYAAGIVLIDSVKVETTGAGGRQKFWDPTTTLGFTGGFGIDFKLGVWFFADIGLQVIGAPQQAGDLGVGRAEPMVASPLRLGVLLNF